MTTTQELRELHAAKTQAQRAEWAAILEQTKAEFAGEDAIRARLLAETNAASPEDYGEWMAAFLALGGQPTHWYDYEQPGDFRVAYVDLEVEPLHGASSLHIVARRGVTVRGVLGHSTVYLMDYPLRPCLWVPVYSDAVLP
jgi:hypothetical protein